MQRKGKIIRSLRTWGAEIETLKSEGGMDYGSIRDNIKGLQVAGDGSISGNGSGIEFQLPPCSGYKAERMIKKFCSLVNAGGYSVNSSCGYHIHIDAGDIVHKGDSYIQSLWLAYLAFDDVILSFLPARRRSNNRYCPPLKSLWSVYQILNATSKLEMEKLWYYLDSKDSRSTTSSKVSRKDGSRYRGVNFHMLWHAERVEIRYHNGTTQPDRILEWANLHCLIFDAVLAGKFVPTSMASTNEMTNLRLKTKLLFDIIDLSKSSQEYFLARQKKFDEDIAYPTTNSFKEKLASLEAINE